MKVKLLRFEGNYSDDYESVEYAISGITDWEEVSEKDYNDLSKWVKKRKRSIFKNDRIVLVTPIDNEFIPECVNDFKSMMEAEKEKEENKKKAALKSKATREKNKLEKEKKEFEKLKRKFEK